MDGKRRRFAAFAWAVLAFHIGVVLWGAYVRASGSGAGCGEHWPLCNGVVVPQSPSVKTLIELSHRLTSGVALILIAVMFVWAFRLFPRGHLARRAAAASGFLIVSEALLGAGLVLLGHVAQNQSAARGVSVSLHLTNTLLLLMAITVTAWSAGREFPERKDAVAGGEWYWAALLLTVMLGVTGAIAALGDTLFASTSLAQGWQQDFSLTAHPFVRLRILHPLLALVVAGVLFRVAFLALSSPANERVRRTALALMTAVFTQLLAGVLNVVLLAPVWMQMIHLLLADLVWIALVILTAEAFWPPDRIPQGAASSPQAAAAELSRAR